MDDKAWGDQDYVVAIWLLVSPPWFGLTAKMGMWRPEGQGYWCLDPPAGG